MYFTTFNHYDEIDENKNENENDLCLICWDSSTTNNNLIKMKSLLSYLLFSKVCFSMFSLYPFFIYSL